jgi:uncharacterized protein (DUF4415 family)
MGSIKSTVKVGQKPPKKEFAQLVAERKRRKKKQTITIRITSDVLEKYKTMGSGYTGIMSDVLQYAVNNPAVLAKATQ